MSPLVTHQLAQVKDKDKIERLIISLNSTAFSPTSAMDEASEFPDWELLHNSEAAAAPPPPPTTTTKNCLNPNDSFGGPIEIEGVSGGTIRSDYFASDSQHVSTVTEVDEDGSVSSDNPSWIEPCDSKNELKRKNSSESWSDSSREDPGLSEVVGFEGNEGLGIGEEGEREVGFEGIGEIGGFEGENELSDEHGLHKVGSFEGNEGSGIGKEVERGVGLEGSGIVEGLDGENGNLDEFWAHSRGDVPRCGEETAEETAAETEIIGEGDVLSSEGEKKGMVWWKVPFEILKFCLFKASPGWSVAVAAAVMGIVILTRRLRRMKRKSTSVPLKITVDDKKVSQFMKNAARLNEAFLVVKRVPIIRPLLPATAGVAPWPVMNLR